MFQEKNKTDSTYLNSTTGKFSLMNKKKDSERNSKQKEKHTKIFMIKWIIFE